MSLLDRSVLPPHVLLLFDLQRDGKPRYIRDSRLGAFVEIAEAKGEAWEKLLARELVVPITYTIATEYAPAVEVRAFTVSDKGKILLRQYGF